MAKKKRRRSGKGKGGKGFKYQKRGRDKWEERAEQSGYSKKRSMVVDDVKTFRPKEDDNLVRILPPTFEDAEHYGYEVFVHWNVGPDDDAFLCLKAMKGEPCPVCEERGRALADEDKEYSDKLTAKKRVFCYIVDRDEEDEGLQLWAMPWTLDADVTTLAVDKRTGEVLDIDDPKNGYDVEFTKQGKGRNTKYVGVAIARKPSKLGNNQALEEAVERPIPECLKFYSYEEIDKIFNAGGGAYDEDEDKPKKRKKGKGKKDKGKKDKGKKDKGKGKKKYEEEVSWQDVQEMDFDDLVELADNQDLDVDAEAYDEEDEDDLEELRTEVCDALDLKKPKKRKAKKGEKEKLRKRGRKRK